MVLTGNSYKKMSNPQETSTETVAAESTKNIYDIKYRCMARAFLTATVQKTPDNTVLINYDTLQETSYGDSYIEELSKVPGSVAHTARNIPLPIELKLMILAQALPLNYSLYRFRADTRYILQYADLSQISTENLYTTAVGTCNLEAIKILTKTHPITFDLHQYLINLATACGYSNIVKYFLSINVTYRFYYLLNTAADNSTLDTLEHALNTYNNQGLYNYYLLEDILSSFYLFMLISRNHDEYLLAYCRRCLPEDQIVLANKLLQIIYNNYIIREEPHAFLTTYLKVIAEILNFSPSILFVCDCGGNQCIDNEHILDNHYFDNEINIRHMLSNDDSIINDFITRNLFDDAINNSPCENGIVVFDRKLSYIKFRKLVIRHDITELFPRIAPPVFKEHLLQLAITNKSLNIIKEMLNCALDKNSCMFAYNKTTSTTKRELLVINACNRAIAQKNKYVANFINNTFIKCIDKATYMANKIKMQIIF